MRISGILFIIQLVCFSHVYGQRAKPDTLPKPRISSTTNAPVNDTKLQLQQQLLLGRQQQLELNRQEQQRILLEKQKTELAEKEKQLLQLRVQKKQNELEQDRKTQAQILQKNQLEARVQQIQKDKQINAQQVEISNNRKWNLVLLIGFIVVASFAIIVYYSQRRTKRLNAVISQQRNEMEQMGMVKDTILGVVSHDMRTPVNTLLSFTELIKAGYITPEKLELYLDQINITLNHTSSLMNNLLNWAASQMQGFKTVIAKVDAGVITENLRESFADRIDNKKILFTNEIMIGTLVMADANMLELVIRNLISNALKFTAVNGKITVAAVASGDHIILSVTDSGVGMPVEKMNRFNAETLEQAESTLGTAKEKGTGLGLLLCKTFSRLMNGTISVGPNPNGQGCRFELALSKA
jgi:signal transduction histidine kinase